MSYRTSEQDAVLLWLLGPNEQCTIIDKRILQGVIADARIFEDPSDFIQCVTVLYGEQVFVLLGRERTPIKR